MGLLNTLGEKLGMDRIPGFGLISNVAEGILDGALLMAGPAGWAVLGAKTAAYVGMAALDGNPKTTVTGALGESVLSIGLGAVGGGAAKGLISGLGDDVLKVGLRGRALSFTQKALQGTDDLAARLAGKADSVLKNSSRVGARWTQATAEGGHLATANVGVRGAVEKASTYSADNLRNLTTRFNERFVRAADDNAVSGIRRWLSPQTAVVAGATTVVPSVIGSGPDEAASAKK